MPMFEYQCEECGYIFEELIFGVNATNEISCPKCKSEKTEKTHECTLNRKFFL